MDIRLPGLRKRSTTTRGADAKDKQGNDSKMFNSRTKKQLQGETAVPIYTQNEIIRMRMSDSGKMSQGLCGYSDMKKARTYCSSEILSTARSEWG